MSAKQARNDAKKEREDEDGEEKSIDNLCGYENDEAAAEARVKVSKFIL